ncbi:porin family protein [Ectothiorhodospiraceae bacterium 2226]|nr:porin family protein [Ectothiorhodospiraceae bacterium 2226]
MRIVTSTIARAGAGLGALMLAAGAAQAQQAGQQPQFEPERLYVGAGATFNDMAETGTGNGFQVFAGYDLGWVANHVRFDAEVGFMSTGNMRVKPAHRPPASIRDQGLWANGVARIPVAERLDVVGRFGLDMGLDTGLMAGIGVGYRVDRGLVVRAEYVVRDDVDSYQINLVYRPQR